MNYILGYFIGINILSLLLMYIDKNRAKRNQYRISEKTLWMAALFGGALGGVIGMNCFRHKTCFQSMSMTLNLNNSANVFVSLGSNYITTIA
ncbi:DUF1294 domain-containing protein [Robertmurraya andreesenii]|uniref:Uncharacterized membrane protein YsdA (DUF1294 family) n=1 Tax=Anoxybacillus andreesenii TaxID=1325932 RepID=A0ABT9V8I0_9BACL|nr:DUF1294 domain-containing protein [Robertmurraya andreesenii]MDQ0157250.1 uncharacterized membrane protein YsdA (DUF1294 family) [Robertmurraya andreesenii]